MNPTQHAIELAQMGRTEEALGLLRRIVALEPHNVDALKWLAATTPDITEAWQAARAVLHYAPDDAWALEAVLVFGHEARRQQVRPAAAPAQVAAAPRARRTEQISPLNLAVFGVSALGLLTACVLAFGWLLLLRPFNAEEPTAAQIPVDGIAADPNQAAAPWQAPQITPQPPIQPTATLPPPPTLAPLPTSTPFVEAVVPGTTLAALGVRPQVLINTQETYYTVGGLNEEDIRLELYNNGPFVERLGQKALGLTMYEMGVSWEAGQFPDTCQVNSIIINLNITYTYPDWQPNGVPTIPVVQEWDRFFTYVVAHEETHGAIAAQCANELATSIEQLTVDSSCENFRTNLNTRIDEIYAVCEQRQVEFDQVYGQTTFPLP